MSAYPSPLSGDRNLLLGVLALQMDFVRGDDLLAAMHAWMLAKSKSLGQILEERGTLPGQRRTQLEALVEEHLRARGVESPPDGPPSTVTAPEPPVRYRILQRHRVGGLGEVYVARDEELWREVALKQIRPKYADHPHSRARFVLEAEITGGLEHPGIVPVYGLGTHPDGRPYYAMRFIRGETLRDAVVRFHAADAEPGRDPAERALAFRDLLGRFLDVCDAVAYAHSRGVLHRDLKPANVMLGPYGETIVVDWGLAKVQAAAGAADGSPGPLRPRSGTETTLTLSGHPIGTPAYMAPEQAIGRTEDIDVRTDVYLLGGILFEILTGRAPHAGGVRGPHAPSARAVKPTAPEALDLVAARALAPARADRPASAAELAEEVRHWLADEPVAAYRAIVSRLADLVRQQPAALDYREQLARNRLSLGLVLDGMSRHADSEHAFREAIADLKALVRSQPAVTRYRADLATARVHLSRALASQGRTAEAAEQQQKAVGEYERLMATNPHEYRTNLASILLTLAPGAEIEPPRPPEPGQGTLPPAPAVPAEESTGLPAAAPDDHARPEAERGAGEPGEVRGRLTLLRIIGSGGMSRIWLARDNDLNREVAIKQLLIEGEEIRSRFLREAQITAQLEHPNIGSVYSLGCRAGGDVPFLVMRYVPGPTLADAIRDYGGGAGREGNRHQLRRLLRALVKVCDGLHYAHTRGVIHRDPKPANVILGERGEVILLDWGLARVLGTTDLPAPAVTVAGQANAEQTQAGAVMGTPAYMAPEQAAGAERAGPSSDIYVLGTSLYHLLTGRTPWQGASPHEVLEQLLSSEPPRPRAVNPSVPAALEAVCLKAMARLPESRYQSAADLGADLERWLRRQPVSVYPESRFRRLVRSVFRGAADE
jgi:serine/threonine protein kinase